MPEYAEIFAALESSGEQWQFDSRAGSHQYLLLYELVAKYLPPGASVLDWGAASGHFSFFLSQSGYEVTGYSLFDEPVPQALRATDYELVVGDPTDPVTLPFEAATFDAVASVGVLEHVRETGGDEKGSLSEIRRILRPGGYFLCYHLPNRYSWIDAGCRIVCALHDTPYRYKPHAYLYGRRDIRELVAAAGMNLVESGRYALLPRLPLNRLPARLLWSERFAQTYDVVDAFLGRLVPWICQNHYFVARCKGDDG